jgi:hypothetical protein
MPGRLLILTAAFHPAHPLPTPFLKSARQAGLQADIVLLCHRRDSKVEQELQRLYPRTYIIAPLRYGLLRAARRILVSTRLVKPVAGLARMIWKNSGFLRKRIEAIVPYLLAITLGRFFLTRTFLAARANEYSAVLLIDSRDVIFQRNPLEDFEGGVLAGVENTAIEDQLRNCEWLEQIYSKSPETLSELWPRKVICSGVTLGAATQILAYLDLMCDEFIEQLPQVAYTEYLDQAVHNKLLYGESHDLDLQLTDNLQGSIVNLATSDLSEFDADWSGGLRLKNGRMVSIVHQYDRHPELERVLLARLESNPESNPESNTEQKAVANALAGVGSQL